MQLELWWKIKSEVQRSTAESKERDRSRVNNPALAKGWLERMG
jgi:hypothetical protein